MRQKLNENGIEPIGLVHYDTLVARLSLMGEPLVAPTAKIAVGNVVDYLEAVYADLKVQV